MKIESLIESVITKFLHFQNSKDYFQFLPFIYLILFFKYCISSIKNLVPYFLLKVDSASKFSYLLKKFHFDEIFFLLPTFFS